MILNIFDEHLYNNDKKVKRGAEDSAESAPKRMRDDTVAHQKIKVSKTYLPHKTPFNPTFSFRTSWP